MRCISPLMIRDKGRRDIVPCGKCNYCLQSKRADWTFRLLQEHKVSDSAHFLTMTYDEDKLPYSGSGVPQLCKQDVVLFTKRLRKMQSQRFPDARGLRYYTVGEYGTQTHRPHYHSIMFNLQSDVLANLPNIWQNGLTYVGTVNIASIHYVTKYVINRLDAPADLEPP